MLNSLGRYIAYTDWTYIGADEETVEGFSILLEAELKPRDKANKLKMPDQTKISRLWENLKEFLLDELEQIPEYLKDMEPKDKLTFITKLMPFILPKLEKVHSERGEPNDPIIANM